MQQAYALLHNEFTEDRQWKEFFFAASYAKKLADLLIDINEIGNPFSGGIILSSLDLPEEFYNLIRNLEKIEHKEGHYKAQEWKDLKHNILESPFDISSESSKHRLAIMYAWDSAPPVSAILYNIANVASG